MPFSLVPGLITPGHLMKEGTASIMDELFVETHERFVNDENSTTTIQLLNEVRKNNVKVEKWV